MIKRYSWYGTDDYEPGEGSSTGSASGHEEDGARYVLLYDADDKPCVLERVHPEVGFLPAKHRRLNG